MLYLQNRAFLFHRNVIGSCCASVLFDETKTPTLSLWTLKVTSAPAELFPVRSGWETAAHPACPKTIRWDSQEKNGFHWMLVSYGVTDGTVA